MYLDRSGTVAISSALAPDFALSEFSGLSGLSVAQIASLKQHPPIHADTKQWLAKAVVRYASIWNKEPNRNYLAQTMAADPTLTRDQAIALILLYRYRRSRGKSALTKKIAIGVAALTAGAFAVAAAGGTAAGGAAGAGFGGAFGVGTPVTFGASSGTFAGAVGAGSVAAGGGWTAAGVAALKKIAIQYGTERAMQEAGKVYAQKQQKKMTAQMEKELAVELAAARREYASLPSQAAKSGTIAPAGALPTARGAGALLAVFALKWALA